MVKAPRSHRKAGAGKKVRERKRERTLTIVELCGKISTAQIQRGL